VSVPRRIGVDLDNTLVRYDHVFQRVAEERGLVETGAGASKLQIRDALRRSGRENVWVELQGCVYGPNMRDAELFPGALEAMAQLRDRGHQLFVISHRTLRPALGPPHDLHAAAREWIQRSLPSIDPARIYLETSREDKLRRIGQLACDLFVDDLPEVLLSTDFPAGTRRILFDPEGDHRGNQTFSSVRTWSELARLIDEQA